MNHADEERLKRIGVAADWVELLSGSEPPSKAQAEEFIIYMCASRENVADYLELSAIDRAIRDSGLATAEKAEKWIADAPDKKAASSER